MTSSNKIGLKDFQATGFNNFPQVCKLLNDGDQLERKVQDNFNAQFRHIKATQKDLQTKFYTTELTVCKDAMNRTITDLKKEIESQNNDKFQLNNKKKVLDAQYTERVNTQRHLQLVLTAFIASVNFTEDQTESKDIADALKTHMTIMKKTPLVGQQLTGRQSDGSTVTLRVPLSSDMLKKLGKYKSTYDTCVQAQE